MSKRGAVGTDTDRFRDPDGNVKPNSWQLDSENPSTFNAMYYLLLNEIRCLTVPELKEVWTLVHNKYSTNGGKYMTNDFDNDDSFSLDESIGTAAMCARFGFPDHLEPLRIWTKQTWYRLYDVIPYLYACKYPILRSLLLPYISLSMVLAVSVLKKGDSSGAQLNLIKAFGLGMKRTEAIMAYILEKKGESFKDKLAVYYPEEDHITNVLARRYFS